PKWLDAQRRVKANQARTPLRLGKVLCEHYESLCQEQNVQLYPSIRLYHRGAFIREYENLDAPTDGFYDWILQQIKAFNSKVTDSMHTTGDASSYPGEDRHVADDADISAAAGVLSAAAAVEAVADDVDATASTAQVASDVAAWTALARDAAKPRVVPNPDGIVVEMFEQDFAAQLDKGPWFIMFHASWCGHCQHLAPVWERLGPELLQQVNVGKIECTVNPNACNNYAIRGYPTLKYINQAA
ncbi:thioredoxin-domain-containing protein, partial [Caulochytrium protostelioides]